MRLVTSAVERGVQRRDRISASVWESFVERGYKKWKVIINAYVGFLSSTKNTPKSRWYFFVIFGRKYTITTVYSLFNTLLEASPLFFYKCLFHRSFVCLTAEMSVFMVFCGPHLPLAFQFVCGPGRGGGTRQQIGRQVEGFPLFGCAAGNRTKSSFCWLGPLLETIVLYGI